MALVLKDRVQETTTTSGTGTLTLAGAVSGFDTFSASIGNGNVTYYTIFDNTAYVWEVGIGTVGAGTLARTTVLSNSSGTTSPINLAGNIAFVFCTYPAEKSINYDTNDVATIGETLGYSDSGIIASFASTVAGYNQVVLQNKSTATNASTNFNVSNDAGTAGSNYAELGINSSTFTGTGSFNIAGASYVASASTDLTLGTYGAYSIHFVTNSSTTDAMTIFNNGGISLGGFSNPGIGNMAASKFVPGYTSVTAAAGTTVLTASSNYYQNLVGTTTQTFQLPDATGLLVGTTFIFDNDSTGTLTVVDNASGPIDTIPGGALGYVYLANNSTVAGTWRRHAFLPASYDFNSTTANFGNATITNAVWNGTTIASGYGGTGLTTFTGANNALYSTNATTLVAGTLPVAAGGTGLTSLTTGRIPYGDGTNPFGSSANLFWDSANNWLGVGTSSPAARITISNNTALPSAGAITGTGLWQVGADATANILLLDAFNQVPFVVGRHSSGTSASPTATASGNTLLFLSGRGYGATGYGSGTRASIVFNANETWTDTAQGTRIRFDTTQNGTTTSTERMRIDDAGNVGIGTTSPAGFGKFAVVGVSGTPIINYSDGTITGTAGYTSGGVAYSGARSNHPIAFLTNDTPRMSIDTSGNVGIGTTAPTTKLTISNNTALPSAGAITGTGLWQVGADASVNNILLDGFASAGQIVGRRSAGTSASPTAIAGGGSLLALQGYGYGATGYSSAQRVSINLMSNEVWSDTAQGTRITFSTTANTTTTTSEKMRIDDAGNVGIGTSSPVAPLHIGGTTPITRYDITGTGTLSVGFNNSGSTNNNIATGTASVWMQQAYPLTFGTNGTERMRIDSSGNVGIGNTTAYNKLDIITNGNANSVHLSNAANTDTGGYLNSAGNSELMLSGGASYNSYSAPNLVMNAKATEASGVYCTGNTIRFWVNTGLTAGTTFNQTERMRIDSAGNVGIGTSSPSTKLDVNGTGKFGTQTTGAGLIQGSSDTFQVGLNINNSSTTNAQIWSEYTTGATTKTFAIRSRVANDTGTAQTQLFIDSSGNVGIGTTSPTAGQKLDVVGGIRSTSLTVDNPSGGDIRSTNGTTSVRMGIGTFLGTGLATVGVDGANPLIFVTNSSERMRIDSTGNAAFSNGIRENVYAVVDAAGVAISPNNGTIQTWTLGASRTPTAGTWNAGESLTLMINDGTAFTVTWTTLGVVWVGGTAPILATTGFTVIELWKVSTTIYGALVGSVA